MGEKAAPVSRQYVEILDTLFLDLTEVEESEKALFYQLFYDREDDYTALTAKLAEARQRKENFTIIGKSGVGKTSFIYRFLNDEDLRTNLGLQPLVVDYRRALPRTWETCAQSRCS